MSDSSFLCHKQFNCNFSYMCYYGDGKLKGRPSTQNSLIVEFYATLARATVVHCRSSSYFAPGRLDSVEATVTTQSRLCIYLLFRDSPLLQCLGIIIKFQYGWPQSLSCD